jgi:hypothetical protein
MPKKIEKIRGGHPRFYELLKEAADLHERKNNGYAKDNDPLSNLRLAEGFGLPPHMGVLIRMSDKFSRIQELSKGKVDKVGESIKDTLMDMAIYSLLAIVLFEEAEKKA